MTLHKINKLLFKKHPIRFKKLVIVFIVFILFMQCLEFFLHHLPTELFRIKELTVEDIDFNDIYYQTRDRHNDTIKNKVVLINIGAYPPDSLRHKFVELIKILNIYQPCVIGVDAYFAPKEDTTTFKAINSTLDSLLRSSSSEIVIGADYASLSEFPLDTPGKKSVNFGCINMVEADGRTMREYYYKHRVKYIKNTDAILSFACEMYEKSKNHKQLSFKDSTFIIKYISNSAKGFYNAMSAEPTLKDIAHDFAAIEADDLLGADEIDSIRIQNLVQGKFVIIGSLGNPTMDYQNDLTDKHRVPLNFQLFNRLPTMPGAVVHANALQMLINGEKEVYKIVGWRDCLIAGFVIFLYLLVFNLLHKIKPILLKLIIEILFLIISTTLLIWLGSYLMGKGYHLNIGKILLYLAVLIEYKMFAFEFYDDLLMQDLRKRFNGWYSSIKYFFIKNSLSRKIETKRIEIEIKKIDDNET